MKRKVERVRKVTLSQKMFLPMVLVVCLYALIFLGMVWYGGVFDQLRETEVERVQQSLNRKVTDIQEKIDSCWVDEEIYKELLMECRTSKEVSLEAVEALKLLTDKEEISGAFVFYENGEACYVRRSESGAKEADYGNEAVLQSAGIPKSAVWAASTEGNMEFCPGYTKIKETMQKTQGLEEVDYACASNSYRRNGSVDRKLTFSIPVMDVKGEVYAVVGIEVSSSVLAEVMEGNDIQGSYMLGVQNVGKSFIEQVVSSGEAYQEILQEENGIWLVENEEDGNYRIGDEGTRDVPYVLTEEIKFYSETSAFADENWVVCAIVDESELTASADKMKGSILTAMLVSCLIGICALYFLSRVLTKPIAALVDCLNELKPRKPVELPKVHIYEVDRLSAAIERVSKEVESYALRNSEILRMADIPVGVAEIDEVTKEVFCTAKMFELLGEVEPKEDHKVISILEFKRLVEKFKRGTVVFEEGPVDDNMIFCDNNIYKVYSGDRDAGWTSFQTREKNGRLIIVVMDVTDKIREKIKLEYERDFDELSHLLNKQAFARETKKRLWIEKNPVAAMIMWDLDNLKTINDTYGHEYGDIYIKEAAKIFAYLEQHNGLVARRSGDEFFAYISGESEEDLREVIKNIHKMLSKVVIHLPANKDMNIRASAGIVWYPKDGSEYEDLIKKADFTMYDVKRSDKGNIREFNKELYDKDAVLLTGKDELNEILERKKFDVVYQPVVDALTGDIYGYEALMRPKTATLHAPKDVIRIAHAQERMEELESVLWEETLNDFFRDKQMKQRIFINSFAGVVMDKSTFRRLSTGFRKEDLRNIIFEMIEFDNIHEESVGRKKQQVQAVGAKMALGEFGVELEQDLEKISETIQFVKFGRELISGVDKDEEKQKTVIEMINRLKQYDILIVAVGIETEGELRFMQKHGADFVQGFYLAKPLLVPLKEDSEIKEKIRM